MTSAPHLRLSVAGALATMLTSLSLSPLIGGHGWLLVAWVVVVAVVATGASMRPLVSWWPAVVAAQTLMLGVILTVLFARGVAPFGLLPGPGAVRMMQDLISEGMDVSRMQAPPVQPTHGILLLTAGGIGLVGLLVDVLAVSLRRPALAGLPLLAVYCLPAALLPDGLAWPYFILAGAGYIALVAADSGDRIRAWGRMLSGSSRRPGLSEGPEGLGRSGRRVAGTCLVVATLIPALVPGLSGRFFGSDGNGTGGSGGRVVRVVNPILTLRNDLNSTSDAVVIRYSSTQGSDVMLRFVTDSVFDGQKWEPSTPTLPGSHRVQEGLAPVPGLSDGVAAATVKTRISVGDLGETFLPVPYPARQVSIEGYWLYDSATLNVIAGDRDTTSANASYTVEHLDVAPTAEQLRDAGTPPADILNNDTKLPAIPSSIVRLARQVGGNGSHYDQAVNLQAFFRSTGGFTYSTKAPRSDNPADDGSVGSLETFLLAQRSGYCVHFASAMAVMARILGIPSRVAVGFLPGQSDANGSYLVRLRDAHAWPELYFQGVGWVRFEPTPAARAATVPLYSVPPPPSSPTPTSTATATASGPSRTPKTPVEPAGSGQAGQPGVLMRVLSDVPWRFTAGVALVFALAACPMLAAGLTRRRWRRGERSAIQRAEGAWEELRQRLADLGARWAPSWTPRALQSRLVQDYRLGGTERAALGRLVADIESARYERPSAGGGRDPEAMAADVRTVSKGVAALVPPSVRRRARWLPSSGVAALLGVVRRVDQAADDVGHRVSRWGSRDSVGAGSDGHRD